MNTVTVKTRKVVDDAGEILKKEFRQCELLSISEVELLTNELSSELKRLYDLIAPETEKKVNDRKRVPWFDHSAKQQKNVVRSIEKKWMKYQEQHQWLAYKRERNRYWNIIKYNKQQTYCGLINNAKGDVKKLYQIAGELLGESRHNPLPSSSSDDVLANEFADFFLNKILTIRDTFKDIPPYQCDTNEEIPKFTAFATYTESDIKKLIGSMKTKSCELDMIPTKLLKEHIDVFAPVVTRLVNLSLTMGRFPEEWKCAIVRPLLKKLGMELVHKSYRPVLNLSFLSKLIEKAALNQFVEHCDQYNLIPDYQSAYRAGFSCETSVLKMVNDTLWAMERKQIMSTAFLDLSAALDTVDHDLLLKILEKQFGIHQRALHWYDSYLRPRSFRVCVGEVIQIRRN